ncbi:MAG: histidine phosphatase family protein [Gammaproteobacteria bacterium]|nr:histidine phosphatase family protein [Gammaproteobacteria bacterium]
MLLPVTKHLAIIRIGMLTLLLSMTSLVAAKDPTEAREENAKTFTVWLIRHAEKRSDQDDPELTPAGLARAQRVVTQLAGEPLAKLYSTAYRRTQQTAAPISTARNLSIQTYDPRHLDEFAAAIKQQQLNALIVGHSNTTGELARLLGAKEVPKIDESTYHWILRLDFSRNQVRLTLGSSDE